MLADKRLLSLAIKLLELTTEKLAVGDAEVLAEAALLLIICVAMLLADLDDGLEKLCGCRHNADIHCLQQRKNEYQFNNLLAFHNISSIKSVNFYKNAVSQQVLFKKHKFYFKVLVCYKKSKVIIVNMCLDYVNKSLVFFRFYTMYRTINASALAMYFGDLAGQ